jgi:UDP:flavonoid glycosyltransferase YjiC (YdhE family)
VLPLAWDQPDNAARVAKLGAGLTLGPRHRSSQQICHALSQLMAPEIRDRCREIAAQAIAENGLDRAAQWVEEFAAATSAT